MDELVYNTLVQYFKLLANFGYVNYTNVYKVLFLISMQDLTTGGFRSLITEDDYRQIERALYKIFGTTCLVPYPQFCSDVNTGKFQTGYLTDLSTRLNIIETNLQQIQDTEVIKKLFTYVQDVDNTQYSN